MGGAFRVMDDVTNALPNQPCRDLFWASTLTITASIRLEIEVRTLLRAAINVIRS